MRSSTGFTYRNGFIDEWQVPLSRLYDKQDSIFTDVDTHAGAFDVRTLPITSQINKFIWSRSRSELEDHLWKTSDSAFRIISFCQEFSLGPVLCSKDAMLGVIRNCCISSMFIDVLLKFGDQPQVFEESSGFRQSCHATDGSFELCYQLMYIEPNGKKPPRNPRSFRQTGVYHKSSAANCVNEVVLIHPNNEAAAQRNLEDLAENGCHTMLAEHPLNIHLLIITTYMAHWQDHNEGLASELEQMRRYIDVADTTQPYADASISPERLQALRQLEDQIVCKTCRCLRSIVALVHTLGDINDALADSGTTSVEGSHVVRQELQLLEHRLQGHINAAEILAQRVRATLGLLTNLLDIGNQANSRQISTRILGLTQESVEDNATVRVITVFTLIYLPASFMASFLGMNLFDFKSEDGSLQASPQFWIFVAATVPLTMLTVGGWYLYKMRQDKIKAVKRARDHV
ncbi:hypothetical protein NX059_009682 [Plenodomus lindquistii]|nr:hypothetical protein NX059_009682 [Plenodomus lindquistii]